MASTDQVEHLLKQLQQPKLYLKATPEQTAIILWSIAKFCEIKNILWQQRDSFFSTDFIDHCINLVNIKREECKTQTLSISLWATAKLSELGYQLQSLQQSIKNIFLGVVAKKSSADGQHLVNGIWAIAVLYENNICRNNEPDFLLAILQCFVAISAAVIPKQLSQQLQAMAILLDSNAPLLITADIDAAISNFSHNFLANPDAIMTQTLIAGLVAVVKLKKHRALKLPNDLIIKSFYRIVERRQDVEVFGLVNALEAIVLFNDMSALSELNKLAVADCFTCIVSRQEGLAIRYIASSLWALVKITDSLGRVPLADEEAFSRIVTIFIEKFRTENSEYIAKNLWILAKLLILGLIKKDALLDANFTDYYSRIVGELRVLKNPCTAAMYASYAYLVFEFFFSAQHPQIASIDIRPLIDFQLRLPEPEVRKEAGDLFICVNNLKCCALHYERFSTTAFYQYSQTVYQNNIIWL